MASKKKGQTDATKFEGNGISFKAKLIGVEEVAEARGDLLCQETMTKLKNNVKSSGEHKQKIFINVTLEGLKVIDAMSMQGANQNKKKSDLIKSKTSIDSEDAVRTDDLIVLHTHAVHRISFISRDTTDNRAFGYIIGTGDGKHTFFAIKTAAAAEQLVLTLRDLFQVVYEMKKSQVDAAKKADVPENEQPSGVGSTSEETNQTQKEVPADDEGVYHVPPNNAPVNGSIEQQQANLLDLEDQADSILKGIEQIKNLEFDSITEDKPPTSPVTSAFAPGTADPWSVPASTPAAAATTSNNSALSDLAGIQAGPFMPQQPFPGQMAGFGPAPGFNMPVAQNPFGTDPFTANFQQQQAGMRPAGFGVAPTMAGPFGQAPFQQPFQQQGMVRPQMPGAGMFPAPNANPNPFAPRVKPQEDPSLLKPIRNDQQGGEIQDPNARSRSPKPDPFADLVGIKKSTTEAKSPKDMFAQLSLSDKKSMNELKQTADGPPKNAFGDS